MGEEVEDEEAEDGEDGDEMDQPLRPGPRPDPLVRLGGPDHGAADALPLLLPLGSPGDGGDERLGAGRSEGLALHSGLWRLV